MDSSLRDSSLSEALYHLRCARAYAKNLGLDKTILDNIDASAVIIEEAKGAIWRERLKRFARLLGEK
jgi:hypothetical protein